MNFPFLVSFIISLTVVLSEKSGLTGFQIFFVIGYKFWIKFEKCCFFILAKGQLTHHYGERINQKI